LFTFKRDQNGFSIVELIVALSVLLIVLALGYQFYFFGNRTFTVGENQSNIQRDIRLTADLITKEIRNAKIVELVGASASDGYEYIYLQDKDIKHRLNENISNITNENINNLTFSLEQSSEGNNVIEFTIEGEEDGQSFDVTTKVHLNNIFGLPETTGQVIKYSLINTL